MKAKRGDAVAIVTESHDYAANTGRSEAKTRIILGIVTSITREGVVKAFRSAAYDDASPQPIERVTGFKGMQLIPATVIATADIQAAASAHHYAGYPNQAKPWESLDELRAALRPHLIATDAAA